MEMTRQLYGERTDLRWPGVNWMQDLLAAYEQVHPNLQLHDEGFPSADHLRSLIRVGNIDFEGEMEKDTEGSDFIKDKLLDEDPTPLYLQAWGGANTIARALKSIEEEYRDTDQWEDMYRRVCDKAVLYAIAEQDATIREYILPRWPDLTIFLNGGQFWCFAYPWKQRVPAEWHAYLEGDFMGEHLINNHGPLLKKYYSYGDGQKQAGDPENIHGDPTRLDSAQWGSFGIYDFISEGDSPAFLHLVDVGLGNLDDPSFGGWGGRLVTSPDNPHLWQDGDSAVDFNPFSGADDRSYAQARWIPTLQEDMAARADWCVESYSDANHPPEIFLEQEAEGIISPGQEIPLVATARDPDGDQLNFQWWQYHEVDTYPGQVEISSANQAEASIQIPADIKSGQTIHLILEVTDDGIHPMTRYQRVVLTAQ
jgi:hypothetical protein